MSIGKCGKTPKNTYLFPRSTSSRRKSESSGQVRKKDNNLLLVLEFLRLIPKGKVVTYKQIADYFCIKNPRLVGKILHQNKNPKEYPCYKVIRSDGSLASGYSFGGRVEQRRRLKKEGVKFENEKVDLKKNQWKIKIG